MNMLHGACVYVLNMKQMEKLQLRAITHNYVWMLMKYIVWVHNKLQKLCIWADTLHKRITDLADARPLTRHRDSLINRSGYGHLEYICA